MQSAGSIPGWGSKIPHASWAKKQNIKNKKQEQEFLGGAVDKNLPANVGDKGSIPGSRTQQRSPCATTAEPVPQLLSPRAATAKA